MIRKRHDIDNELIIHFLENSCYDRSIQKSLLDWYALLEEKDYKQNRDKAIAFIKGIAEYVLMEVEFPSAEKDRLIGVFEPLETILRTAQSLNVGKKEKLRDHLSHTIRVLLLSEYLLEKFYKISKGESKQKREVFIAAIFHDMAYPIEKIKKVGESLSEGTFKELLNSNGKIEFSLNDPKALLELMNFWGSLPSELEKEYEIACKALQGKGQADAARDKEKEGKETIKKIKHVYTEILVPAIAGQGLFNVKHNLSSVVLFLQPIYNDWKGSRTYLNKKIDTICNVCLAIAYHDRDLPLSNFKKYEMDIPLGVKVLRIADELQEWDRLREKESYTQEVTFGESPEEFCVEFKQKDSETELDKVPCNPCYFIPDKIAGLLSVIENNNSLSLKYILPEAKGISEFTKKKKNLYDILKEDLRCTIQGEYPSAFIIDKIELRFIDNKVEISFPSKDRTDKAVLTASLNDVASEHIASDSKKQNGGNIFIQELDLFYGKLNVATGRQIPKTIGDKIKQDIEKVFEQKPLLTLKKREQLGLLRRVDEKWKTATHTRYQHSMGVTAKCIAVCDYLNYMLDIELEDESKSISSNTKFDNAQIQEQIECAKARINNLKLTTRDVKELALAAALHDCAHPPLSHAVERAFLSSDQNGVKVRHEDMLVPLLLFPNPYFQELLDLIVGWSDFDKDSPIRVAAIISLKATKELVMLEPRLYPKKAILQLLSSNDVDLDRLDFIIRDAEALKYDPVNLLADEMIKFIRNLTLVKTTTLRQGFNDDVELCVKINKTEDLKYLFYILVCRVLLYKYCYFCEKVRSFEAVLTHLVSDLLANGIAINPLKLISLSDIDFLGDSKTKGHLEELVGYITDEKDKEHYQTKFVNVLKKDKTERFKKWYSIELSEIGNARLAKELEENFNKHLYINNIKNAITEQPIDVNGHEEKIEREDIMFDVFSLKTGGGNLLVKDKNGLKTLNKYMNGSNIHHLCTETRLDVYHKSDIGDTKKKQIKTIIDVYYGKDGKGKE